jgi:predicted  nucleic acid-binding Zn-ribbon protein
MRHVLEEVMRQEHHRVNKELEELMSRLTATQESDAAGEQAIKRSVELDYLENEVAHAETRKQTLENFFRRLSDEVLGNPRPSEGHPGEVNVAAKPRPIYDRPQA